MADITICTAEECPAKEYCYRAQAEVSEFQQAYADFSRYLTVIDGDISCAGFIKYD